MLRYSQNNSKRASRTTTQTPAISSCPIGLSTSARLPRRTFLSPAANAEQPSPRKAGSHQRYFSCTPAVCDGLTLTSILPAVDLSTVKDISKTWLLADSDHLALPHFLPALYRCDGLLGQICRESNQLVWGRMSAW